MTKSIIQIILVTLIYYAFGSVCAGTLNIGQWSEIGRVILAIFWIYALTKIEIWL